MDTPVRHVKGLGDVPFRLVGNGGRGGKEGSQGSEAKHRARSVGTVIWKGCSRAEDDDFDENEIDFWSWGTSTPVSRMTKKTKKMRWRTAQSWPTRGIHKGGEISRTSTARGKSTCEGRARGRGNKTCPRDQGQEHPNQEGKGEDAQSSGLKSVADIGLVGFQMLGRARLRAISAPNRRWRRDVSP